MLIALYVFLSGKLGALWVRRHVLNRLKKGLEHPRRYPERWAIPSAARPDGPLCWIHGASVGESLSVLPLITRLLDQFPHIRILVTTHTLTSAALLAERLPPGVIHQFCPFDIGPWVDRFLDHWKPQWVLWVESEIWPNQLLALKARRIPMALINGRLSKTSYKRWCYFIRSARSLFSLFDLCFVQAQSLVHPFQHLGARGVRYLGNLKFSCPIAPAPTDGLDRLRDQTKGRPLWVAASTHDPEEKIIVAVHQILKKSFPQLLTIIIPRHPRRGDDLYRAYQGSLTLAQRSTGQHIQDDTDIYIADTLGEVGLFYRLSPIVFLGGSFVPVGGHNPIEPALLGSALLTGPHVDNFRETYDLFVAGGGALLCADPSVLEVQLTRLLTDQAWCATLQAAAHQTAQQEQGVLDAVMRHLWPFMTKVQYRQKGTP